MEDRQHSYDRVSLTRDGHHGSFWQMDSIPTRGQGVVSGASSRVSWLFETTESDIQKRRLLQRRIVKSESLSEGLPLVVEPIIY